MNNKENDLLVWNVYFNGFNANVIEIKNIFWLSSSFIRGFVSQYKKHKAISEEFLESVKKELMYAYCSKCEYEILLEPLIGHNKIETKIDVYDQVTLNWDAFKQYLLSNETLIKKYCKQYSSVKPKLGLCNS